MGEAKRRKKNDPTWGKSVGQFLAEQWQLPELQPESVTGWVVALTIVMGVKPSVFVYQSDESDCRSLWDALTHYPIDDPEFESIGVVSLGTEKYPLCKFSIMRPDGMARFIENSVPMLLFALPQGDVGKTRLLAIMTNLRASEAGVGV